MRLALAVSIAAAVVVVVVGALGRDAAAEPAPLVLTADGATAELAHARAFVKGGRFIIMLSPSAHGCEQTFEDSVEQGDVHLHFKGKTPTGKFQAFRDGADSSELATKATGTFVLAGGKVVGHVEVTWASGATLSGDVDAVVCAHPGAPAAGAAATPGAAKLGAAGKTRLASMNGTDLHVVLGRDLPFEVWDAEVAQLTPAEQLQQAVTPRVPLDTCFAHGAHVRDPHDEALPADWANLPTAGADEPSCCVMIDYHAQLDTFLRMNPQGRQPDGVDSVALAGSHLVFTVVVNPGSFSGDRAEPMDASLSCHGFARSATLADLQAVLGDAVTIVPGFVRPKALDALYRALPFTTRAATADDWKR